MADSRRRIYAAFTAVAMIFVVAGIIAIHPIEKAPPSIYLDAKGESPYGYTWSLALFILPVLCLWWWFANNRSRFDRNWRAFWWTVGLITPLWTVLDAALALRFFTFVNRDATLRWNFPGLHPEHGWGLFIPIEEFIFYWTGSLVILLTYIWACEVWVPAYTQTPEEYEREADGITRATLIHWNYLWIGLAVFFAGWAYKYSWAPEHNDHFPGYWAFLLGIIVIPTSMFIRVVGRFINFRAFSFMLQLLLLVSLMWEVTLALPNEWWNYQREAMLGVMVKPWANLPAEAALLWLAAAFNNVVLYEVFKLFHHTERGFLDWMVGAKPKAG